MVQIVEYLVEEKNVSKLEFETRRVAVINKKVDTEHQVNSEAASREDWTAWDSALGVVSAHSPSEQWEPCGYPS